MSAAIPTEVMIAGDIADAWGIETLPTKKVFAAAKIIARAILAERERIAAKADEWARDLSMFEDKGPYKVMSQFADSIRRGK